MFVIKELLTPKISAEVTAEIARAIEILKEEPAIKEAKLFGSAIKGRWRPNRSDIDLAVFSDGEDRL